ncbi:MAG TPA: alpha/beta fold hydrolase [Candidatus Eisenbacteria bacterium]|jgi:pimeloyl-ACP methyl ester carboxylesterase|nr:alpha/beta fold hydrolase [Candidatus Eisenbacteria bacterium]
MIQTSGTLQTNGAKIAYEVEGTGTPVLFIHAGIANMRMWDHQVAGLRDRYRLIRYDCRGFGLTETEKVSFSNRADIAALLDHLGERSAHVVGLSRGGVIGLDFAIENPERVRSLVFAAGGISGYDSPASSPEAFDEADRLEERRDWDALSDWETRHWVDGPGQRPDRVPASLRAQVHEWILSNYRAEKESGQPQPLRPPAVGRLTELKVPLLVLVGTLDEPGTVESCRHLAASVPGARLEIFEGAAHMLNLEQPDRFTSLLRQFLPA